MLSKEVLNEELDRFNRIDEKASKYLTILTFLIGVYGFFCNWIIKDLLPPTSILSWSLLVVGGILFIAVSTSWVLIFWVLRQRVVIKIPLDDEMLNFFHDNRLVDIYYTLAKGNKDALKENRAVTGRKARILDYGYKAIAVTICLVFVFSFLFGIYYWKRSSVSKANKKGGCIMSHDEEKNKEEEPKIDIKPPVYDKITEGVDNSNVKKVDKDK